MKKETKNKFRNRIEHFFTRPQRIYFETPLTLQECHNKLTEATEVRLFSGNRSLTELRGHITQEENTIKFSLYMHRYFVTLLRQSSETAILEGVLTEDEHQSVKGYATYRIAPGYYVTAGLGSAIMASVFVWLFSVGFSFSTLAGQFVVFVGVFTVSMFVPYTAHLLKHDQQKLLVEFGEVLQINKGLGNPPSP